MILSLHLTTVFTHLDCVHILSKRGGVKQATRANSASILAQEINKIEEKLIWIKKDKK